MEEEKCNICNSEMKISKRGILYCSAICWKDERFVEAMENEELKNIAYECTLPNLN